MYICLGELNIARLNRVWEEIQKLKAYIFTLMQAENTENLIKTEQ